jgi:hypothetical protein
MYLFIDPVLLAVPGIRHDAQSNVQAQTDFATYLLNWNEEAQLKRYDFCVGEECIYALFQDKNYPDAQTLRQRWGQIGLLDFFSPEAASALAQRFLSNTPHLEHLFPGLDLKTIDVDDADFLVNPDLLARLTENVRAALLRALGRIAWVRANPPTPASGAVNPDPADLLLATHPIGVEPAAAIRADVLANDYLTVEADLPLVSDPRQLEDYIALQKQWRDPAAAIYRLGRMMIAEDNALGQKRLSLFTVGPDLADSILRHEFNKKPGYLNKLFRLCVLLLTESGLMHDEKQHHRLGKKGNPVTSGRWDGWRLWINDDNPGYRLHYWRNDDEFIFMHVCKHDDYSIDSPPFP